ncbi:MAG: Gfo/Idh/MocA family oxidoreductase [Hyphomonadaceae bacterium]|nr:Gfo/Idh/MocA family oxidoreductase [Hyphomonadaceae bacterium]
MLKAGLIGYGLAGRYLHAPLMALEGFDVRAAVTSRAADLAADFPAARALPDLDALLAEPLDLVVVASPSHLHVEHARAALEAGRHVVIDKPFAAASVDALALVEQAEQKRRVLSVYQNRRWDSDFLTLRRLLAEGRLGTPTFYEARWDRFRPQPGDVWRERDAPAAGMLYDLGSHLIDQALVLFGIPDWLQADVAIQRDGGVVDDCFQILMGKGALRISLGCTMVAPDSQRITRVLGPRGAYVKRGIDPQEAQLRAQHSPAPTNLGTDETVAAFTDDAGVWAPLASERGDWRAFYRGMRAAISDGAPPPVPPREAARVIALIEAALEGSHAGRRIDIPAWLTSRGF